MKKQELEEKRMFIPAWAVGGHVCAEEMVLDDLESCLREAVVPDADGATQQKQQTGEAASAHRQVIPAAEKGAGRRWGDT